MDLNLENDICIDSFLEEAEEIENILQNLSIKNEKNPNYSKLQRKQQKPGHNDSQKMFKGMKQVQQQAKIQQNVEKIQKNSNEQKVLGKYAQNSAYYIFCPQISEQQSNIIYQNQMKNIPKFSGEPRFIMYQQCRFKGVKISLQNNKVTHLLSNKVLILPFKNFRFQCFPSKHFYFKFDFDLKDKLLGFKKEKQTNKNPSFIGEGSIFLIQAPQTTTFDHFLFLKMCEQDEDPNFAKLILKDSLKNVFKTINKMKYESFVIPRIDWPCLEHSQICQILFDQIFNWIQKVPNNRIKYITIAIYQSDIYLKYCRKLRTQNDNLFSKYL